MKNYSFPHLLLVFVSIALLLLAAGCSPKPPLTAQTPIPDAQQTTAAPTEASTIPFPLAGDWAGTVINGSVQFEVALIISENCARGEDCGTFDIPIVPCSGSYVLTGEENGTYEFEIKNKSAKCGEGKDSLQLLQDGTLKFISRGDYGVNEGVLTRKDAEETATVKLPVIFDDDGSPDGTTALLYLLSDPAVSVQAVTISHGEAHPQVYIQHMGRMLQDFGLSGIPLGAGLDSALQPGEDFPEWLRQASDTFWGMPVPNAPSTYPALDAAELMVSLLNQAPGKLAVFISGPCTDLARALRLDAGIREHISAVYIMGGAVNVPGNLTDFSTNPANVSAEWNIYVDPVAADEVFRSGLPIVLVPLDATNQVFATMADTRQWRAGGKPADLAADMYDMLLGGSESSKMGLWDVMTAGVMVHPELCELEPMNLKVITEYGDTYGQTLLMEEGEPNVQVCLEPDVAKINQTLVDIFSDSQTSAD